jgi:hypothetical protein
MRARKKGWIYLYIEVIYTLIMWGCTSKAVHHIMHKTESDARRFEFRPSEGFVYEENEIDNRRRADGDVYMIN